MGIVSGPAPGPSAPSAAILTSPILCPDPSNYSDVVLAAPYKVFGDIFDHHLLTPGLWAKLVAIRDRVKSRSFCVRACAHRDEHTISLSVVT